jgi:hypothetical protein
MEDILTDAIRLAKERYAKGENPSEIIELRLCRTIISNVVRNCLYQDIPLKILNKQFPMFSPINEDGIKIKDAERLLPQVLRYLKLENMNELFYVHNQQPAVDKILDELIRETYNGTMKWRTHKDECLGTDQMSTRDFEFGIYKRDYLLFQPYSDLSITYIPFGGEYYAETVVARAGLDYETDRKILQLVDLAYSMNPTGIKKMIVEMAHVVSRRYKYRE